VVLVTKETLETNVRFSSTLLRKLCAHYANGFDNAEKSISFSVTLYLLAYNAVINIQDSYTAPWTIIQICASPNGAMCNH
jgi:hypothetical protein